MQQACDEAVRWWVDASIGPLLHESQFRAETRHPISLFFAFLFFARAGDDTGRNRGPCFRACAARRGRCAGRRRGRIRAWLSTQNMSPSGHFDTPSTISVSIAFISDVLPFDLLDVAAMLKPSLRRRNTDVVPLISP